MGKREKAPLPFPAKKVSVLAWGVGAEPPPLPSSYNELQMELEPLLEAADYPNMEIKGNFEFPSREIPGT